MRNDGSGVGYDDGYRGVGDDGGFGVGNKGVDGVEGFEGINGLVIGGDYADGVVWRRRLQLDGRSMVIVGGVSGPVTSFG